MIIKTVFLLSLVAGLSCSPRRSGLNPSPPEEGSDQNPSSGQVSATIVMKPKILLFRKTNLSRQVHSVCNKIPTCLKLCQHLKQENCEVSSGQMVGQWVRHIKTYKNPEEVQKDLHRIATDKERADFLKNADKDHRVLMALLAQGPSDSCLSFERQAVSLRYNPYAVLYLKKPVDTVPASVAALQEEALPEEEAEAVVEGEPASLPLSVSEESLPPVVVTPSPLFIGPPAPSSGEPAPVEDSDQEVVAGESQQNPSSSPEEEAEAAVLTEVQGQSSPVSVEEESKSLSENSEASEEENSPPPASLESAAAADEEAPVQESAPASVAPLLSDGAGGATEEVSEASPAVSREGEEGTLLSQGVNISLNVPLFMGFSKKCFEEGDKTFSQLAAYSQNSSAVQSAHDLLSDACSGHEDCIRLAYCEVGEEDPLWSFVPEDIKAKGCDYESFLKD